MLSVFRQLCNLIPTHLVAQLARETGAALVEAANAVRWQAFLYRWGSSFVRLWTCVRAALWLKLEAVALLKSYGTAGGDFRLLGQPEAENLPGFRPAATG